MNGIEEGRVVWRDGNPIILFEAPCGRADKRNETTITDGTRPGYKSSSINRMMLLLTLSATGPEARLNNSVHRWLNYGREEIDKFLKWLCNADKDESNGEAEMERKMRTDIKW